LTFSQLTDILSFIPHPSYILKSEAYKGNTDTGMNKIIQHSNYRNEIHD